MASRPKRRLLLGLAALALGGVSFYLALLLIGFANVPDAASFEAHPDEHRAVLDECRAGGGWFPECEAAEAIAPVLDEPETPTAP